MLKGSSIKAFRLRKKLTQDELSRKLGISASYLSKIESDNIDCPSEIEEKFYQVYEKLFNRVDMDVFKERYPYNGVRLLGDSNDDTIISEPSHEIVENVIRKLRKRLDFTQEEFGKKIGLSSSGVSKLENGNYKLPSDLYNRILLNYSHLLFDFEKLELKKMTNSSYSKIHNFVLNNDIDLIMEQIIDMKLEKSDVKVLFNEMLEHAKILKKERS